MPPVVVVAASFVATNPHRGQAAHRNDHFQSLFTMMGEDEKKMTSTNLLSKLSNYVVSNQRMAATSFENMEVDTEGGDGHQERRIASIQ